MPPRVAALITAFFPYSHADVIVSKFLRGFPTDDRGLLPPRTKVTAAWLDQIDARDMGQALFWRFGVPLHQSIRAALTGGTGKELQVDGIILIGEHGDYPYDELGRHMYPRRAIFEQVCGVFAETGAVCPVFCDKHLAYNWEDATWMIQRARQLGVPLMAGSSVPIAHRRPFYDPPLGCRLDEALTIAYGPVEAYGYHAVELLQSFVERRGAGETGVAAVTWLAGAQVWAALDDGRISRDLFESALASIADRQPGDVRQLCSDPWAFLIEYRDGLRGSVVMLNPAVQGWAYAEHGDRGPQVCEVHLQDGFPHAHFNYLSLNIEEMFVTGQPSYPVERTLLATGITDAMMHSRHRGERVATPWLDVAYRAPETIPWRSREPRATGENLRPWPPRIQP
ncbi:MAG: hypothetical protein IT204_19435 [Fimbriimonadaceae bacterium]|nr:hypothetical protein [Fimbriimonadaceae bacterium]